VETSVLFLVSTSPPSRWFLCASLHLAGVCLSVSVLACFSAGARLTSFDGPTRRKSSTPRTDVCTITRITSLVDRNEGFGFHKLKPTLLQFYFFSVHGRGCEDYAFFFFVMPSRSACDGLLPFGGPTYARPPLTFPKLLLH